MIEVYKPHIIFCLILNYHIYFSLVVATSSVYQPGGEKNAKDVKVLRKNILCVKNPALGQIHKENFRCLLKR